MLTQLATGNDISTMVKWWSLWWRMCTALLFACLFYKPFFPRSPGFVPVSWGLQRWGTSSHLQYLRALTQHRHEEHHHTGCVGDWETVPSVRTQLGQGWGLGPLCWTLGWRCCVYHPIEAAWIFPECKYVCFSQESIRSLPRFCFPYDIER